MAGFSDFEPEQHDIDHVGPWDERIAGLVLMVAFGMIGRLIWVTRASVLAGTAPAAVVVPAGTVVPEGVVAATAVATTRPLAVMLAEELVVPPMTNAAARAALVALMESGNLGSVEATFRLGVYMSEGAPCFVAFASADNFRNLFDYQIPSTNAYDGGRMNTYLGHYFGGRGPGPGGTYPSGYSLYGGNGGPFPGVGGVGGPASAFGGYTPPPGLPPPPPRPSGFEAGFTDAAIAIASACYVAYDTEYCHKLD